MLDYLLDAMNEISDEHITEAVNYEAKAKKLNLKKIIPMAACFVFVIVAVIAGAGLFESPTPNTTEPTLIGTPTNAPTQAPVQDSTTVAPTQCPTQKPWEDMTYGERYTTITVEGVFYVYATESVSEGRIGEKLITENAVYPYVEIYGIKGMTNDLFVAVKFSEDESGEYFLYLRNDYKPEILGDLLDAIGLDNLNFIGNSAIYQDVGYNYDGKGWSDDNIEIVYNLDAKGHKELSGLLWKNRNSDCVEVDNNSNLSKVTVRTELLGQSASFSIEESGIFKTKTYLHIYIGTVFSDNMYYSFEIEDNAIKDYVAFLEDEAEVIRAERYNDGTVVPVFPEQLTSTTTPTTEGTTPPYVQSKYPPEVADAFGNAEYLGDIVERFDLSPLSHSSDDFYLDYWAKEKAEGKENVIYSISVQTMQDLVDFIWKHKDAVATDRVPGENNLIFNAFFMGNGGYIYLGDDGYIYFLCGDISRAFFVGEDAVKDFKANLVAVIWTPENPVTLATGG